MKSDNEDLMSSIADMETTDRKITLNYERKITTVRIPAYLRDEAKEMRINVSRVLEDALRVKIEEIKRSL